MIIGDRILYGVEGYCLQLQIMQYISSAPFPSESVFVSMHRMLFSIPAELCYALVPIHSRQQNWQLITNFIPPYHLPHFPQPNLSFATTFHEYLKHLRQRHMPSAQVKPRFTFLAHAHPAHIARLTQLTSLPSMLSKPSGQKRSRVPLWAHHCTALSQP